MKIKLKSTIIRTTVFIFMSTMTITFLYPLYFMFINAMKTKEEYYVNKFILPKNFNIDNFRAIIVDFDIFIYIKNSIIISGISTSLIVFFSLFAGYAFAKLRFKFKTTIYILILATMFLPGQVSMIPAYVLFSKLNLINSHWSVILTYLAGGLPSAILLFQASFRGISNEMVESAKIDGAGYFVIIKNIIVPMGLPAISIVVIFNFIGSWNDLLTPMLYLSDLNKQTVMVALSALVQRTSKLPTYQLAGLTISLLPAIIIYLGLQKYLIKGISSGSIK